MNEEDVILLIRKRLNEERFSELLGRDGIIGRMEDVEDDIEMLKNQDVFKDKQARDQKREYESIKKILAFILEDRVTSVERVGDEVVIKVRA